MTAPQSPPPGLSGFFPAYGFYPTRTRRDQHLEPGANSRLDEMQAAILRARLPLPCTWTEQRRALAGRYRRALDGAPVAVPAERDAGHVYHLFPVRTTERAALQDCLKAAGIETLVHYPVPIPRQPALQGMSPDQCAVADRLCDELLSLPLYPALTESDVAAVGDVVQRFRS